MDAWTLGFAVAGVVVLIVAVLLLAIIYQCRRIVRLADAALATVERIDAQTRCIWSLRATNATAGRLRAGAEAIAGNARAIARAVQHASDDRAA